MTILLLILALGAALFLLFCGGLIVALRRSEKEGGPQLEAWIRRSPPCIEVSIALPRVRRRVRVERIILSREVAEALGARPPAGFHEVTTSLPDFASFQPDLEELAESGAAVTAEEIDRLAAEQYREHVAVLAEGAQQYVSYQGALTARRGTTALLEIPLARAAPMSGELSLLYSDGAVVWRGTSGIGCSLQWASRPS